MSVIFNNIVGALLLPPLNLVLLCAAGLLLTRKWPRTGFTLSVLSLLLLMVFSTKAGARLLIAPLEQQSPVLDSPREAQGQAIVVLGGGRTSNALEYGGKDVPSYMALVRLRYAATLYRETGLPILVTGGVPETADESEAALMARSLREDFSVPVKWREEESRNTAENALFSARMLKQAGATRILLVTDAIHMPRSREIFAATGLDVVAAPTALLASGDRHLSDFIPGGEGLRRSHYALHEWVGIAWYRLRYRSTSSETETGSQALPKEMPQQ
jgi:uncharacterized SAM-binding protein YcdF (DUF218 family)